MDKPKWTPGPWRAKALGGASTVLSKTAPPKNDRRAQVTYGYRDGGEHCIAYPFMSESNVPGDRDEPRMDLVCFGHADAKLIAAAPALYEALAELCERFDTIDGAPFHNPPDSVWGRARAALSSARGGESV